MFFYSGLLGPFDNLAAPLANKYETKSKLNCSICLRSSSSWNHTFGYRHDCGHTFSKGNDYILCRANSDKTAVNVVAALRKRLSSLAADEMLF